jgi:D-alanyl-D-alanine carboxypeptidase/D-alanyl-D-alanine-endopeptidase (penicillin-binding protein 4)
MFARTCLLFWLAVAGSLGVARAQGLPPEVEAVLARANVPRDAVVVLVQDAEGRQPPRVSHRAAVPVNPASIMKLVTTFAALDQLGPAFVWTTPVYVEGAVRDGTLHGNLYIKGQGDPKLVVERLWLLLRRVQGLGIHSIAGDIVLDRGAFDATVEADPAAFDGEPLRPYNAAPDALLINFKAVVMTFVPDKAQNAALVHLEPPLAGMAAPSSVPLLSGDCGDYRAALKADFSDPARLRLAGGYPAACGEKTWGVAYADPKTYAQRAVAGLWDAMGGKLSGAVREGRVPAALTAQRPAFEASSLPLLDMVRDINKYSNNVMAQQLFLTLGLQTRAVGSTAAPGTWDAAREAVRAWWLERFGAQDMPVLDNGAGLSRSERISAQALGQLLLAAYRSPLMPELMSSLPIAGVDGTLKRSRSKAYGSAHLKTGTLRDVVGMAGYVHARSGRQYILVAIANHPSAGAARPAFDLLLDWVTKLQ